MSKSSGDTARYNRIRKQRARKREKIRALRAALLAPKAEPKS
jgi:hypothetical protein